MPTIHVASLADAPRVIDEIGASHLMTLLRLDQQPPTPSGIASDKHLRVDINDISLPTDELIAPAPHHVEAIIEFARRWDQRSPMLIHCFAGISRSTAAAYICVCALKPDADPLVLARELRRASPTATPNPLMIDIADGLLGHRGGMLNAIEAIGRGEMAMSCTPFRLAVR